MENFKILRRFTCDLSDASISYYCDNVLHEITFGEFNINHNNYKLWFMLLKESIQQLTQEGYTFVIQFIPYSEWLILKSKTTWIEKNVVNDIVEIRCHINDILLNIKIGLDLDQL